MVEYLDPEIAGEGSYAAEPWSPSVPEAKIPDYKGIKSIAKYFPQFTGRPYVHKSFPCWFYHKTKPAVLVQDLMTNEERPRLIKDAVEWAKELGCVWRKSTGEEISQGFPLHRWEYGGEWRATPFVTKFDPANPGPGKTYVKEKAEQPNQADLIGAVVAAVLAKVGQSALGAVDADRAEFEAFKAWKALEKATGKVGERVAAEMAPASPALVINALAQPAADNDKTEALKMADEMGVKVDRRLSADKILAELSKVTGPA